MTAFWDIELCRLKEVERHHPDDGGSMHLWNVSVLACDYKALYPTRLSCSHWQKWEPQISLSLSEFTLTSSTEDSLQNKRHCVPATDHILKLLKVNENWTAFDHFSSSMQQIPTKELTSSMASEPKGLSLCSQEPASGPYPEPTESTPHPYSLSP
jgi:hypothetical protein